MPSRLRLKDERSSVPYTAKADIYDKQPTCSAGASWRTYASNTSSIRVGKLTSMSDFVVPGFHSKRARGEVFFNPMARVSIEVDSGSGNTPEFTNVADVCSSPNTYKPRYRYPLEGSSVGRNTSGFEFPQYPDGSLVAYTSIISPSDLAAAITEASTSCLNERGRADSNLFETLYEADKILGTVPSIVAPALKSISQKSGLLGRARNLGSAYLAYRYGLKPLMSDLEAVRKGLLKQVGRIRQTARGSVSLSGSNTTFGTAGYGGACTFSQVFAHQESLIVRAMSLDEYEATVGSNIGFTAKGLATLPWEILPYSFVIDWFANIGDFFGAIVPALGYNQLGSCLAIDRTLVTEYSIGNTTPNTGLTLDRPVSGSCKRTWNVKSRASGPLSAGLVVKSNFRLTNATRAADAISLILQKIK